MPHNVRTHLIEPNDPPISFIRTGLPKLRSQAIVTILASRKPQRILAEQFGVSQQTISKVKRRIHYSKFGKTPAELEYESWNWPQNKTKR